MSARRRLVALCAVLAAGLAFAPFRPLTVTLLVLLAIVTVHEFGHFAMARVCKVGASEFSVGFGPEVAGSSGAKTGTRLVLRAVPLGGFVRIDGMEDNLVEGAPSAAAPDRPAPDTPTPERLRFSQVSATRRFLIAVAGPAANVLSAVVLLMVVFMIAGRDEVTGGLVPADGSPAALAGLLAGDVLVAVDGSPASFDDLAGFAAASGESGAASVFSVRGVDGAVRDVAIVPVWREDRFVFGVSPEVQNRRMPAHEALPHAGYVTGQLVVRGVASFADLASAAVALPVALVSGPGEDDARMLSPVGAARLASESSQELGWRAPVGLVASASVFIALFNLLPFPPLDGAHAAIAVYEGVGSRLRRRRVRVDPALLRPVTALVVSLVLALGVGTLILDILQPVTLP